MQNAFISAYRATFMAAASLICVISFVPDVVGQPSFDCRTNTGPDERTICASRALSQMDRRLSNAYLELRGRLDSDQQIRLRDVQRNWLRQRANCVANVNCIAALYQTRIPQLEAMLAGATTSTAPSGTPQSPSTGGTRDACDAFPTLCQ
jgi:uncharacterized protein